MKVCPECHKNFTDEVQFCPKDGLPLAKIFDKLLGTVLLGQFEIEEVIGHGAMGKVYRAKQLIIDRTVAVKVLQKKLTSDSTNILRFKREATAVAKLNHPNIIGLYLTGETEEEGLPFMVMEHVDGPTLDIIFRTQGAMEPNRMLALTKQIVSALGEAHRNNVLHRDLKPANIKILYHGTTRERVKVLDFGIAKLLHSEKELAKLTKTGTAIGTPAYISPEQAMGDILDPRSDLYSLGVLMFHMATGQLPFENRKGRDIISCHINDQPPNPQSINPGIPLCIELMIMKLLQKEKMYRYQTSDELLHAVDQAIIKISQPDLSVEVDAPLTREVRIVKPPVGMDSGAIVSDFSGVKKDSSIPGNRMMKYGVMTLLLVFVAALTVAITVNFQKKDSSKHRSDKKGAGLRDKKKKSLLETAKLTDSKDFKPCSFDIRKIGSFNRICNGTSVSLTVAMESKKLIKIDMSFAQMFVDKVKIETPGVPPVCKVFRKGKNVDKPNDISLLVTTKYEGISYLSVKDPRGYFMASIYTRIEIPIVKKSPAVKKPTKKRRRRRRHKRKRKAKKRSISNFLFE
jgi:eukaryotic-like serine/threonine-protein kinase